MPNWIEIDLKIDLNVKAKFIQITLVPFAL